MKLNEHVYLKITDKSYDMPFGLQAGLNSLAFITSQLILKKETITAYGISIPFKGGGYVGIKKVVLYWNTYPDNNYISYFLYHRRYGQSYGTHPRSNRKKDCGSN